MNVARGGTLVQHLPESHGHDEHRRVPGSFDGADHDVRLAPARWPRAPPARAATARSRTTTRASTAIGEGFEVTGWATLDELPEAIEGPSRRFALGVQWHPEADERSRLIAALVAEAAAAARNGRR